MSILGRLRRRRRPTAAPEPSLPSPRLGGPAETWLRRAEKSARSLRELRDARRSAGPIVDLYSDVADGADDLVADLRRLAGEVTVLEQAIARIPSPQLQQRRTAVAAADPGSAELAQIDDQLATDARIRAQREQLLHHMESGAVALDGLLARAAELDVTSATAAESTATDPAATVAELRDRLDGVRLGLAETEAATRRALGLG